jgi:hypothetical protein
VLPVGNAARLQVEKEEDIIRNETTPGQDVNGEEVCRAMFPIV